MRHHVINILSFDFAVRLTFYHLILLSFSGYHNAIEKLSIIHFIKHGDWDATINHDVTLYKIVFYEMILTFKRDQHFLEQPYDKQNHTLVIICQMYQCNSQKTGDKYEINSCLCMIH